MKISQHTYYDRNFNIIRYLELDENGNFIVLRHFDTDGNTIYVLKSGFWSKITKYDIDIEFEGFNAKFLEEEITSNGSWWAKVAPINPYDNTHKQSLTLRSSQYIKVDDGFGSFRFIRK